MHGDATFTVWCRQRQRRGKLFEVAHQPGFIDGDTNPQIGLFRRGDGDAGAYRHIQRHQQQIARTIVQHLITDMQRLTALCHQGKTGPLSKVHWLSRC